MLSGFPAFSFGYHSSFTKRLSKFTGMDKYFSYTCLKNFNMQCYYSNNLKYFLVSAELNWNYQKLTGLFRDHCQPVRVRLKSILIRKSPIFVSRALFYAIFIKVSESDLTLKPFFGDCINKWLDWLWLYCTLYEKLTFPSIISCLAFRRVYLVFVRLVHPLRNAGPFIKSIYWCHYWNLSLWHLHWIERILFTSFFCLPGILRCPAGIDRGW